MSIIHVNQIKNHISRLFGEKIDMSDAGPMGVDYDNQFLSRSLAAYAIHYLSGADLANVAKSITDGSDDNGIDAIFFHEPEKRLYIVQSKWIHDGSSEPSNGDMKKFIGGVKDLFNMRFERFNKKVNANKSLFIQVLNDPQSTYNVVVVYTGINTLAHHSQRDLDDLRDEMNDASELLVITTLNQSALHSSLTARLAGEPINVELGIKSWGKVETPHVAFYGQVAAPVIADWWSTYGDRLFARNLRSLLGDTDVNTEMRLTLQESPENFWYFNNGITIIANKITKTMAGGGGTDFGTFHCENISVVNGAQTVSTIGRYHTKAPEKVSQALIPLRIISLEKADSQLQISITKTNNRQNRIDNRDFVTLDPEQTRLRAELGVEGIMYHVIRSEAVARTDKSFDLVEATTSLACASGKPNLFVQLKREIGKLWEDITRAPYKELFNPTVNSFFLWRSVQTQRLIDKSIDQIMETNDLSGRDLSIVVHGNRMISAIVFKTLPLKRLGSPEFDFASNVTPSQVLESVQNTYTKLKVVVDESYSNAIIPTLFKNMSKCSDIYTKIEK
ncbi:AIPR protein [Nitrosomonas oligotropha]|uniref:AIPR protein n=1 Tax=Nitrosomonas oligotropha TaxID=42354 RepID=A0A2T5I3B1_9PROT|nr:AIPR family protein [Nitrosomonas oligotropha]PTQ78258.1 AIPR protein [Nitrosomonas oligotropha]